LSAWPAGRRISEASFLAANQMRQRYSFILVSILALICGGAFATSTIAAEPVHGAEAGEHESLPLKAAPLFQIGKFSVTNSMLVTWIVAAGLIVFAQVATRKVKPVPDGIQNFWEWLVESLYNFLESVIGRDFSSTSSDRRGKPRVC
jgi:F0F1-type ATP synthase membrane subunit a